MRHAGRVLPPTLAALLLGACGGKEEAAQLVRPVRSVVVTGGSSAESATYTAEIRSRFETDLSFQVPGKLIRRELR